MQEKATVAGKLVNTMPTGLLVIQAGRIGEDVCQVLSQITAFTGKESIEAAGIRIPE